MKSKFKINDRLNYQHPGPKIVSIEKIRFDSDGHPIYKIQFEPVEVDEIWLSKINEKS